MWEPSSHGLFVPEFPRFEPLPMPRFSEFPVRPDCLALLLVVFLAGCLPLPKSASDVTTGNRSYSPLSTLRMSHDLVSLEIAVATLDGEALKQFNEIWKKADLQSLPLSVRRMLDQNGFRTGLLGNQLPGELSAALSWSQPLLDRRWRYSV